MTTPDRFFTAFQALDSAAMMECYHPDAHFRDPVFDLQGSDEIGAMWTSLCRGAQDFSLEYEIRDTVDGVVHATWQPSYRFSQTNRMVHNVITTEMAVTDGLIERHHDSFDLARWCRQALGLPGMLFGWSGPFQRQVQSQARRSIGLA